MRFRTYGLIGALCIGLLAGCGGGDGSAATNPSTATNTTPGTNPDTNTNPGTGTNPDTSTNPGTNTNPGTGTDTNPGAAATLTGVITTGSTPTPVAGATVSAAGQSTVTNATGSYTLAISNPGDSAVLLVRKNGYMSMSKQAPVHADITTMRNITLYPEDTRTTFDAAQGKIVVVNGAVIDIPANAIQDASGAPYTGTVTIAASYTNPTTTQGVDAFPQPYQGIDGSTTGNLQTLGVIEAQLSDTNGQPLQLRAPATLTYPGVSAIDQGAASIPLWYYDDTRAIWVHEGQAQRLVDGSYQGQVSHFTQWNLDFFASDGQQAGTVKVCIQFQNGATERSGIEIIITGPGVAHPFISGTVDAGDLEFYKTPINTAMTLTIMDAGNGKTTYVPVPPVPSGGTVSLPCQTLVGTDDYVSPGPVPDPSPVPADAPASVFAGTYGNIGFSATDINPSTVILDSGFFSMTVQADGSVTGMGSTTRQASSWNLNFSGQVAAGGYVTLLATPVPGSSAPPYTSISFTGQFPLTVPNSGPSGTWSYNGFTAGAGWTATTQFSPASPDCMTADINTCSTPRASQTTTPTART